MVELVRRNLRISVRKLRKNLTLSLVIMLTLALVLAPTRLSSLSVMRFFLRLYLIPIPVSW